MMKSGHPGKCSLLTLLLGLLGLSATSCFLIPDMYGCPNADWTVKGKVVDETGQGVPGLQVALGSRTDNEPDVVYDQNYWPLDTLQTGPDGVYQLSSSGFPFSKLQVDVKDIDGPDNGGEFGDASVVVSDFKYKGGSGWYEGTAQIDVPDIVVRKR